MPLVFLWHDLPLTDLYFFRRVGGGRWGLFLAGVNIFRACCVCSQFCLGPLLWLLSLFCYSVTFLTQGLENRKQAYAEYNLISFDRWEIPVWAPICALIGTMPAAKIVLRMSAAVRLHAVDPRSILLAICAVICAH